MLKFQNQDPNEEKNLFLETDLALHEHCQTCVILSIPGHCDRYGCKVITCPHDCGRRFHSCKTEEHLLLCPLVKAPCINAVYGCPLWMYRRDLGRHLSTCPASIVYCNMERNRKPLKEFGKKLKRKDGRVEEEIFVGTGKLETDLSDFGEVDHFGIMENRLSDQDGGNGSVGKDKEEILEQGSDQKLGNHSDAGDDQKIQNRSADQGDKFISGNRSGDKGHQILDNQSADQEYHKGVNGHIQKPADHQNQSTDNQNQSINHQNQSIDHQNQSIDHQNQSIDHQNQSIDHQYQSANHYQSTDHQNQSTDHQNQSTDHQNQSTDHQNQSINLQNQPTNHHIALDLALAYSDQRQINNVYKLPRSQRKAATNFFNKRHPAVPLLSKNRLIISDQSIDQEKYRDDEGDSSDDEAAARRRSSLLPPVARECILCKIDPSSQHLHQLRGSMIQHPGQDSVDFEGIELDENANESLLGGKSGKPWTVSTKKGASFYAERGLLIDLSADFLPTHYPKCGSYYTIVCDQSVRRDEYGRHFANVHNDIVDGLDGWALIRCPLWRYGCGCYASRLEPADGNRKIIYNRWRDAFAVEFFGSGSIGQDQNFGSEITNLDMEMRNLDMESDQLAKMSNLDMESDQSSKMDHMESADQQNSNIDRSLQQKSKNTNIQSKSLNNQHLDFLALPYDILCIMCTMLDPSSLFCLSATCRSLNDFVRYSLLPQRGLVERGWLKMDTKTPGGRTCWVQGGKRWTLSKSFEEIHKWRMKSTGRIVDHIQKCPYYEALVHKEERIPVLTFAKPFVHRPSRRDMYRAVPMAIEGNEEEEENAVFGF